MIATAEFMGNGSEGAQTNCGLYDACTNTPLVRLFPLSAVDQGCAVKQPNGVASLLNLWNRQI
jgi:hypothetical protein